MATMFTRTVTTYRASAWELIETDDGDLEKNLIAVTDYQAVSDNVAAARSALREAGYNIPRGTKITVKEIKSEVYGMSVEEFMRYAHKVER